MFFTLLLPLNNLSLSTSWSLLLLLFYSLFIAFMCSIKGLSNNISKRYTIRSKLSSFLSRKDPTIMCVWKHTHIHLPSSSQDICVPVLAMAMRMSVFFQCSFKKNCFKLLPHQTSRIKETKCKWLIICWKLCWWGTFWGLVEFQR